MAKRSIPKPFSAMTKVEKIAEARRSISRLEATLAQSYNRFGAYGDNTRDAIARWRKTLADLGVTA